MGRAASSSSGLIIRRGSCMEFGMWIPSIRCIFFWHLKNRISGRWSNRKRSRSLLISFSLRSVCLFYRDRLPVTRRASCSSIAFPSWLRTATCLRTRRSRARFTTTQYLRTRTHVYLAAAASGAWSVCFQALHKRYVHLMHGVRKYQAMASFRADMLNWLKRNKRWSIFRLAVNILSHVFRHNVIFSTITK